MWARSIGGGVRSRPAERGAQHRRVVGLLGRGQRGAAQRLGQRRGAVEVALLVVVALGEVPAGAAEARVLQHPLEQLLGRLGGRELVELGQLLAGQHQPRLELEQRGDQHQELGRGLEVELLAGLQVVQVGDDDVGQLDLEQVHVLAQDQREQQVERPREDVEVQLQSVHRGGHVPDRLGGGADGPARRPTPIASRTSATTGAEIARARSAPVREQRLERRLVAAQLVVALAHRRQPVGHLVADGGLEVAVAAALELALDRRRDRRRARRRGSRSGW